MSSSKIYVAKINLFTQLTGTEKWAESMVGFTETIALHHVSGCRAGAVKQTASDQLLMTHFVVEFNTMKNEERFEN